MKKYIILLLLTLCAVSMAKIAEPFAATDTLRNSFIKIACGTNGLFTLGTADGKNLLFGFPQEGSTSHTYVRFDTLSVQYGNYTGVITDTLHVEGNSLVMTWTYAEVDITQKLTIVEGASTGNDDTMLIEYFITNRSGSTKNVGILLEMDTKIHYNDAAPISTSSGYAAIEQDFSIPNIPQYWQAFQSSPTQAESLLVGQGTLIGGSAVMPDRFCLGPWGTYNDVTWDHTSGSSGYGDSAVLLWWNPTSISNGGVRRVATLYGIGAGSVAVGELALNITAPLALSVDSTASSYSPNPFSVNCLVTNTTTSTVNGVTATITLPAGLSLASGETATKAVSPENLGASQTGSVSWNVVAANQSSETTLQYTVSANGGGYSNSINRNITLPELASDVRNLTLKIISSTIGNYPFVNVVMTVVDSITNPLITVPGLTASNFRVWEDGSEITDFQMTYIPYIESAKSKDDDDEDETGPVDVVTLIDVSSYMAPHDSLKMMMMEFVASITEMVERDFKVALIAFTDEVKSINDFSSDIGEIRGWGTTVLQTTTDNPAQTSGLQAISRLSDLSWTEGSQKVMIYISARPYQQGGGYTTMGTVGYLRGLGISPIIMGPEDAEMRMLADSTSGVFVNIEILNTIMDSLDSYMNSDLGHYSITYQSPDPNPDGSWHEVEVMVSLTVSDSTLSDNDFDGYYAPSSSGFYFDPETTFTREGYNFRVDVKAAVMVDLFDVHFTASFDPTKVRLDSTVVGELLGRSALSPLRIITNSTGFVDASITRNGSMTGVNGTGTVASLYFTTLAQDPTSSLQFTEVEVRNPDFEDIPTAVDTTAYIRYLSGTGGGTPGDTTDCMLCDFDCDGDIDTRDFVLLGGYWQPANTAAGDVGPGSGLAPRISSTPDGVVNFEDLFVFSRMWNWYHSAVLGHYKTGPNFGEIALAITANSLIVSGEGLPPVGMAHLVLEFDPARTTIISAELGELSTGFVSREDGIIEFSAAKLADFGGNAELYGDLEMARIEFKGENTFRLVEADLRDGAGQKVILTASMTPAIFSLEPIRPNPFNPVAAIEIQTPAEGRLSVEVFDIAGRKVATVIDGIVPSANHSLSWDGNASPSGIYFIKAAFEGEEKIQRAVLLK